MSNYNVKGSTTCYVTTYTDHLSLRLGEDEGQKHFLNKIRSQVWLGEYTNANQSKSQDVKSQRLEKERDPYMF